MVDEWWGKIPAKFPGTSLDYSVVMPNHFHGIIILVQENELFSPSLPEIIQWFKTMTTNAYIRGVKEKGWEPFMGKLWQRNYYEHIIRNETELDRIRAYIELNPAAWDKDIENPIRQGESEFYDWLKSRNPSAPQM